jgi:two-component system, cell cycle sensor histidine kinase and response regulator CckA
MGADERLDDAAPAMNGRSDSMRPPSLSSQAHGHPTSIGGPPPDPIDRFTSLLNTLNEGVIVHSRDGRVAMCNRKACEILRLSEAQMYGDEYLEMCRQAVQIDGSPVEKSCDPRQVPFETGQPQNNIVIGLKPRDANIIWLSVNMTPLFREGESSVHEVLCTLSDISHAIETKHRIETQERWLAEAQRIARLGSWTWEPATNYVWWSDAIYELFGLDKESTVPSYEQFLSLVHPEDRQMAIERVNEMLMGADEFASDLRIIRPDQTCVWIHSRARAHRDEHGRLTFVEGIDQDINDRKQTEHALKASEQRLGIALQAAGAVTFEWDIPTDSIVRHFSVDPALPVNTDTPLKLEEFRQGIHPDDLADFDKSVQHCLEHGQGSHGDYHNVGRLIRPDGSFDWFECWGMLERDSQGKPRRMIAIAANVTDRILADEEFQRTSRLLTAVADGTTDAVFVKSLDGRYLFANQATAKFIGKPLDVILGTTDCELFDPISVPTIAAADNLVIQTRKVQTAEETLTVDGITRTFLASKGPYLDVQGNIIGVFGIARDITQRKATEKALKLTQHSVDHSRDLIFWVNAQMRFVYANHAACAKLEYDLDEVLSLTYADIDLKYSAERSQQFVTRLQTMGDMRFESQLVTKSNKSLDVEVNCSYFKFDGQEVVCLLARDVTTRKRTERLIHLQHAVVRTLAEATDLRDATQKLLKVIGEAIDWQQGEFWLTGDRSYSHLSRFTRWVQGVGELDQPAVDCGVPLDPIVDRVCQTQSTEWLVDIANTDSERSPPAPARAENRIESIVAIPIASEGRISGVLAFFSTMRRAPDSQLTEVLENLSLQIAQFIERKRIEERIQLFRSLLDQANDFIEISDWETGEIIDVNQRGCEAHGYTREEYVKLRIHDTHPAASESTEWRSRLLQLREAGNLTFEGQHRRKDGTIFPVEVSMSMIHLLNKEYVVSVIRDIADRKQTEERLRMSQKMEAIGQLAGGIAHDFNNLLTVINCHSQLLIDLTGPHDPLREHFAAIQHAGDRAAELTSQLLTFSRRKLSETKVININDIVQGSARLLARLLREDIELKLELNCQSGSVLADAVQLERMILNLAVNARDAMQDGGTLRITTTNTTIDRNNKHLFPELSEGLYILLEVGDTGRGIPHEVRTRIFEPFFTTKDVGAGTGLGLAVVHGIVQQYRGQVLVESVFGEGTIFRILLPVAESQPDEPTAMENADAPSPPASTVLVVDDEVALQDVIRNVLTPHGFGVLTAHNGVEALQLLKSHSRLKIDLLLTDVVMPSMRGDELARRIRQTFPHLRTIFMSGYAGRLILEAEYPEGILNKPFTPKQLLNSIRRALGS